MDNKEILTRFKSGALDREHVVALLMGRGPVTGEETRDASRERPSDRPGEQPLDRLRGQPSDRPRGRSARARPVRAGRFAVVSMRARFPGVPDLTVFWQQALTGPDAAARDTDVDADRATDRDTAGGGDRGGDAGTGADFDAEFFGLGPEQAQPMGAQERLLLEAAWETLESAGYAGARLDALVGIDGEPRSVGVYVAAGAMDRAWTAAGERDCAGPALRPGPGRLPHQISELLDLRGPSQAVDAGDASFLVALHLAMAALRADECAAALVGVATPGRSGGPGGPGGGVAGVGAVLLKPLADAEADGDTVHAVIGASAVGHHGRTTADGGGLAERLWRRASTAAGLDADELGAVLREDERTVAPYVGDRAEAGSATGLAALARAMLQLRHATLLPTPGTGAPRAWVPVRGKAGAELPRRAGVSVCGEGTGAVLALEEAPPPDEQVRSDDPVAAWDGAYGSGGADGELVLLSAPTPRHLAATARRLAGWLRTRDGRGTGAGLAAVARELRVGRAVFGSRLAVIVREAAELADALDLFAADPEAGEGAVVYAGLAREPLDVPLLSELPETEAYLTALWRGRRLSQLARLWLAGVDVTRAEPTRPASALSSLLPGTAMLRTAGKGTDALGADVPRPDVPRTGPLQEAAR